jgi:hypothetical protein
MKPIRPILLNLPSTLADAAEMEKQMRKERRRRRRRKK